MQKLGISAVALITGLATCSGAIAGAYEGTQANVEKQIADHDPYAAGQALAALIDARLPLKETGKPDPLLDKLTVDLAAANGHLKAVGSILQRLISQQGLANRNHYRLLWATYEEQAARFDQAERDYQQLAASADAEPGIRHAALLGRARIQMTTDPSLALESLKAVDDATLVPSERWEFDLVRARAESMAGGAQSGIAAASLDKAWAEAPSADIDAAATAHVAGDRALAASRNGDRGTFVAMLAVDRSARAANSGQDGVVADLPICGTGGITPQDHVIVDVSKQPQTGRPAAMLVWASRPGIGRAFLAAIGQSGTLHVNDGQSAQFALACRTVPAGDYVARNALEEDTFAWVTGRGAYGAEVTDAEGGASALASRLAERQARYGSDSVMLFPILTRLMAAQLADGAYSLDGRKQFADTIMRISTIVRDNHAPTDIALMWELSAVGAAVVAQTKTDSQGQAEIQAILKEFADDPTTSVDLLYMVALSAVGAPTLATDFKANLLYTTLSILKKKTGAGDPRIAAVAIQLFQLKVSQGDMTGAIAVTSDAGLQPDQCTLAKPLPHYVASNIQGDDYPSDLNFTSTRGSSYMEFGLNADGTARDGRILMADPPYAFDNIALERTPTIRYDAVQLGGKPAACRGYTQSIRWQLPY